MTTPSRKVLMVEESGAELSDATELPFDAEKMTFSGSGIAADNVRDAVLEVAGRINQTISLCDNTYPYIQVMLPAYSVIAKFIFPGTSVYLPSKIYASASLALGDSFNIRIYDATNAKTICEKTGMTGATTTVYDLDGLSNLPSSAAIFEVHLASIGAGAKARCSSIFVRG